MERVVRGHEWGQAHSAQAEVSPGRGRVSVFTDATERTVGHGGGVSNLR